MSGRFNKAWVTLSFSRYANGIPRLHPHFQVFSDTSLLHCWLCKKGVEIAPLIILFFVDTRIYISCSIRALIIWNTVPFPDKLTLSWHDNEKEKKPSMSLTKFVLFYGFSCERDFLILSCRYPNRASFQYPIFIYTYLSVGDWVAKGNLPITWVLEPSVYTKSYLKVIQPGIISIWCLYKSQMEYDIPESVRYGVVQISNGTWHSITFPSSQVGGREWKCVWRLKEGTFPQLQSGIQKKNQTIGKQKKNQLMEPVIKSKNDNPFRSET